MRSLRMILAAGALASLGFFSLAPGAAAGASSVSTLIDFNEDERGNKPNGFTSVDSAIVHFSDSMGEDLQVLGFGGQSHKRALAVNLDDQSFLIIDTDVDLCGISMAYGNDDPGASQEGDQAVLTILLDGVQVGEESETMNRNDKMDQRIGLWGTPFNQATFFYDVTGAGLIEIVDSIRYTEC
jgi:hypothetical protein